jgi:hypothetical protein
VPRVSLAVPPSAVVSPNASSNSNFNLNRSSARRWPACAAAAAALLLLLLLLLRRRRWRDAAGVLWM